MFIRNQRAGTVSTNARVRGIAMRGNYYRIEPGEANTWTLVITKASGGKEVLEFSSREAAQLFLQTER